jgi:hypothetical protein
VRINFFSGPGAGKSTCALGIAHELKKLNYNVELINEFIKDWAYMGRPIKSFDRIYFFGQQLHREDLLLQCGVKHIVTDSPLLMIPAYGKWQNWDSWEPLLNLTLDFEKKFPSINIFLDRKNIEYKALGRYENYTEAVNIDLFMEDFLENVASVHYKKFESTDLSGILEYIKRTLNEELIHDCSI